MEKNKACPSCKSRGRDTHNNHLFLMKDGRTWYCSRCGYKEFGAGCSQEQQEYMDLDDIKKLPSLSLPDRKLNSSTLEHYNVKVEVDEANGQPAAHYYPVCKDGTLVGYKKRTLPKTFSTLGNCKGETELFGQSVCPKSGKRLLIVGGEIDCLAAYQMLREKYPQYNHAVVSLPKGESPAGIKENLSFINSFDEVIIGTDMDEVGRKVADNIAKLIGPKAKIMKTSEKDASDMLVKGKKVEFISAFYDAEGYKPKGFVTVKDVFDKATAMPTWGKSWPWPTMTKLTYGRRLGEGIYFGAGVKVGKSEAVNQIVHHITQVEGGKVAVFKLEEEPSMTVRKVAGKIMHKQFHVPDGDFTQEELVEGVNKIGDSVILYDCYGSTSWDDLKDAIRYAVIVDKCQDIIIDPLTRLTTGMDAASANTELERIADEISKMAKDLGFFYMFFCHLKAPQGGKPHEEGGTVHSNQFTGSRAMMRACYYMVGIERDKTLEDEIDRNTSTFVLLEDRAFGNSGRFDVFYDKGTGDYLERDRIRLSGDY